MAVRIPVYQQQTATPDVTVRGGDPRVIRDNSVSEGFNALAQGAAALYNRRQEEKEGVASAWAADALARVQREAPRKFDELKQAAGEGGTGVVEGINGWMEEQTAQLLEQAPTESSKKFLRQRMTEYRTRLDLGAYEYERGERLSYTVGKFDSSIESGAAAAASNPGLAPTIIGEIRASIQANEMLPPEVKRAKEEMLVQTVSYADVLGELERDPYAAQAYLRQRIGIPADATPEQVQLQMEGAIKLLEETEEAGGFTVPAGQRREAITHLMAGGDIGVKDGQVVSIGKGTAAAPGELPLTYGALSVPKVIELLGRADAEIQRRENAEKQNADFGKILFRNELENRLAAARAGEGITIPPFEQTAFFMGEEQAILIHRELEVAQAMQGDLARMDGMSNEELAAIVAAVPEGTENRTFRDEAYRIKAQRVQALFAARKEDPGGYVLQTSQPVQQSFARVEQAQEELAQAGPMATPEQVVAFQKAQTQYIQASTTEQRRLGILEPKLPKAYIAAVTQRFNEGMAGDQAPSAAAELEGLAINLLDAPDAIAQVQAETGLAGALAIDGVNGMVIKRVQNMAQLSEAKVKELLPAGVLWGDIEKEVASAFIPLDQTLAAQGDVSTASRYRTAGQLLAADYLHSGKATNASQAAKLAYEKLFAERNVAAGTYRIPLTLPADGKIVPVDPDAVQSGLSLFMDNITPDMMQFPVDPGFTAEESFARNIRTVRARSYWANNQTGTGVILMGPDGPQRDPDGAPIEVSFQRAIEISANPKAKAKSIADQFRYDTQSLDTIR